MAARSGRPATAALSEPLLPSRTMRIAVLSDIHANLPALNAVLKAIGSVDAVWHLGDVGIGRAHV